MSKEYKTYEEYKSEYAQSRHITEEEAAQHLIVIFYKLMLESLGD